MDLRSSAFGPGEPIPRHFRKDGDNVSPPLTWHNLLPDTRQLALLVEDANDGFVHWIVYGIPIEPALLVEGISRQLAGDGSSSPLRQGTNGFGHVGWDGPAAVSGPPHHYAFHLYALTEPIDAPAGLDREGLMRALGDRIHAIAELLAHGRERGQTAGATPPVSPP